jgi:hypothetical protein
MVRTVRIVTLWLMLCIASNRRCDRCRIVSRCSRLPRENRHCVDGACSLHCMVRLVRKTESRRGITPCSCNTACGCKTRSVS